MRAYCRIAAAVVLLASAPAHAVDVFKWVDKEGNLHATQILADVPEPYYSMYAAELRRREEARKAAGSEAAPAVVSDESTPALQHMDDVKNTASRTLAQQKKWRDLVAEWRRALTAAMAELEAVDQRLAEVGGNPILRQTPQVQAQLAELAPRRDAAVAAVAKARRMLLEELPQAARKEGVPPRWLD